MVARGVDLVQVHTRFEIGRRIVQEEQRGEDRAAYREESIPKLMRLFCLQNQDRIGQTVTDQFNTLPKSQSATGQLAIFQSLTGKSGAPAPRSFTLSWTH